MAPLKRRGGLNSEGQSRMTKKKANIRGRKVWHITDFREIFELSDDLRKKRPGPLTYTKSPVMLTPLSKEPDIKLWEKLQELKSRPERHLLRSVFEDLKCWAGLKTIKERGYLITTSGQPASYEYIAGQLKMGVDELEKAMLLLEVIGLIERVSKKTPDKSGQGRTKADRSGRGRKKPDTAGRKRKPLKEQNKTNGNGKGKSKGNKKRLNKNKPKEKAPPAKTTQSLKPQIPQRGGKLIQFTPPSTLEIEKKILHRYTPQSKQFAFEIYQALALPWDPTSEMGRRELGCFASVWEKIAGWGNAGIPMEVIAELRDRAISEAKKIAKRRQNRRKGAVWCHVFKNLEAACQRRMK